MRKNLSAEPSIVIIIDYFGAWPVWFPLFLESCRYNPTINWIIHTDCNFDHFKIENVSFKFMTKDDYVKNVNKKLNLDFTFSNNYKLCDLKPMYGKLYENEIKNYDFYGYGDVDVIYGNIRNFYTKDILKHFVVSTHVWCISGHLALFKNTKWIRNSFKRFKGWKTIIENPECVRFDEDLFINVFKYPRINSKLFYFYDLIFPFTKKYRRKLYFSEQFTTPLTPGAWLLDSHEHPQTWYWKDGEVTNDKDINKKFIYLHFMNFVSGRWMDPKYRVSPTWKELKEIIFVKPDQMIENGLLINRSGFHILPTL